MDKDELLEKLRANLSRDTWNNWLTSAEILEINDKKIIMGLRNIFIKETVEKRFGTIIHDTLSNILGKKVSVEFREIPITRESKNSVTGPIIKNRPLK